jgi:hypothetical protein
MPPERAGRSLGARRFVVPLAAGLLVGGCGLFVPELQESIPHGGQPSEQEGLEGQAFVNSIVFNVTCEVRDAIVQFYRDYPDGLFLNTWGVQVTLSLQVEEKSSANPNVNWLPPSPATSIFNFNFGLTGSADATRIDKINWFLPVSQFRGKKACGNERPSGVFILESDLRLKEWLYDAINATRTRNIDFSNEANGPFKQNVLSHEVKFEVISAANAIPGWKLVQATINQSGTGLTTSRDRTHDLTITFGPAVASGSTPALDANGHQKKDAQGRPIYVTIYEPTLQAANSHLASEIGLAVANGLKSALVSP